MIANIQLEHDGMIKTIGLDDVDRFEWLMGAKLEDLILVKVISDVMAPALFEGDQVLINTSVDMFNGYGVYAFEINGNAVLRGIDYLGSGKYLIFMHSDRKLGTKEIFDQAQFDQVKLIGKSTNYKFGFVPGIPFTKNHLN